MVAINFSDDTRRLEVSLPYRGAWRDAVGGARLQADADNQVAAVEVKPLEGMVYVRA